MCLMILLMVWLFALPMKYLFSITTGTSGTTTESSAASAVGPIVGAVVGVVIIALLVILIVMIAVWFVRRGKKTGSMDIYGNRPISRSSKDIFFHMEETVVS